MWSGVVEVMSTAPPAEADSALAVLQRRDAAGERLGRRDVALVGEGLDRLAAQPQRADRALAELVGAVGELQPQPGRVLELVPPLGRSSSVTPCRPSGGTMWLPGGRWPPSMTSRMCGVAARSSAPKRGRSLRSGGSRLPRSSSEVETSRIGPTASASRVLCACGSHFTQSQWVRFCSELSTATIELVGVVEGGRRADHRPGGRAGLLGVAAQLDAVEGAQVDRRRQVGLEPVHDEQPVQGGGGGRVDLVDRRALRRHQLERQRLRAQAVAHVQEVVVGAGVLPQPGAVLGQRGQRGRLGVVPVERPALLVGGLARHLADVAEVAEVLRARARDLLRALLTLPVDLDDDEAERGEEEHAGGEEAAAAGWPRRPSSRRARSSRGCRASGWRSSATPPAPSPSCELGRWLQHDLPARHLRLVEPLSASQCRAHASPVASPDEVATMIGAATRAAPATTLQRRALARGTRRGNPCRTSRCPAPLDATIALSIHGPAGVLDLVVPAGATAVDVAREYAKQADRAPSGHPAAADRPRRAAQRRRPARRGRRPARRRARRDDRRAPAAQGDPPRRRQERRRRAPRSPR